MQSLSPALLVAAALFAPAPLAAQGLGAPGLAFSDERGGFEITGVSGRGTLDDPYVVREDIFDPDGVVLVVRGLAIPGGALGRHGHLGGFALRKVVTNRSGVTWSAFRMELQEVLGSASGHEDGLSFGQAVTTGRPFRSDRFDTVVEVIDTRDDVVFRGGQVRDGETFSVDVVVTDTTPVAEFYLLQQREQPVAGRIAPLAADALRPGRF